MNKTHAPTHLLTHLPATHSPTLQIYAQGMSVAAKSVVALQAALAAALSSCHSVESRREAARGLGPAFHRQLAAVVAPAWTMATAEDMR